MSADLNLDWVLDAIIETGSKGVPRKDWGKRVRDVPALGWRILDETFPMPVAILDASALDGNLRQMQGYVSRSGAKLAPHGKTTMCPQLFARQVEMGAWGITVANFYQASVALRCGVDRVVIANEVVNVGDIEAIAELQDADASVEIISLVDSLSGIERLESTLRRFGARRKFEVLLELGRRGQRCGVRESDEALEIARRISESDVIRLRGVECYEGLVAALSPPRDKEVAVFFLRELSALLDRCREEGLFEADQLIVSAGGSAYFDLVVDTLAESEATLLIRSGCYVTHDWGYYEELLQKARCRSCGSELPVLRPALVVWAQVLSRPEEGLAIVGAGRRDISDDAGLPAVVKWYRPEVHDLPVASVGRRFVRMNDQHGYLQLPEGDDLRVGDLVALGPSHPCTTIDRWPHLLEVDGSYAVRAAYKTYF